MNTTSPARLVDLLHQFAAVSLGEGDVAAGANVLAAKCISLANLSPPGSCLVTPEGAQLPVGLSFMTAGGLTNSLVGEKVLNPISMIQNNLSDHLSEDAAHSARKLAAMSPQEHARARPEVPQNCSSLRELRMELDPNGISAPVRDSSPFRRLLVPSSHLDLGELEATPVVFLSGDSVVALEKQLPHSHRRYPFIRATLTDGRGAERPERLLLSVMRGTGLPSGVTTPVYVRGHVAASCSADKLTQSKETGQESLLANLLWLVDGDRGQPSVEKPAKRWRSAMQPPHQLRRGFAGCVGDAVGLSANYTADDFIQLGGGTKALGGIPKETRASVPWPHSCCTAFVRHADLWVTQTQRRAEGREVGMDGRRSPRIRQASGEPNGPVSRATHADQAGCSGLGPCDENRAQAGNRPSRCTSDCPQDAPTSHRRLPRSSRTSQPPQNRPRSGR